MIQSFIISRLIYIHGGIVILKIPRVYAHVHSIRDVMRREMWLWIKLTKLTQVSVYVKSM